MSFRIRGLPAENFEPLFQLSDEELARQGAVRRIADARSERTGRRYQLATVETCSLAVGA